jgi:hypothetical protein
MPTHRFGGRESLAHQEIRRPSFFCPIRPGRYILQDTDFTERYSASYHPFRGDKYPASAPFERCFEGMISHLFRYQDEAGFAS